MKRLIPLLAAGFAILVACDKTENGEILEELFLGNTGSKETPAIPTSGLIAWYPFDGDVQDASGRGHHGEISGNITPTVGRKGKSNTAYQFYADPNTGIVVPHHTDFVMSRFTINFWFYDSTGNYNIGTVIHKGDLKKGTYSMGVNYVVACTSSNKLTGVFLYGNDTDVPPPGDWHMLTGVVSGNLAKIYLDGVFVREASLGGSFECSGNQNLVIGLLYYHNISSKQDRYPFKGKLDDIRIYNRALSQREIDALYLE